MVLAERSGVERARALIHAAPDAPLDLRRLADEAGLSRFHFIRAFRQAYGQTPHQYLLTRRIERAKRLLAANEASVTEACFATGFRSLGSFSSTFSRRVGLSPIAYRTTERPRHLARKQIPACFLIMYGPDRHELG